MFKIDEYEFNTGTSQEVGKLRHNKHDVGNNWPVVYVINNDDEAYVGETVNAARRIDQHLQNEDRQRLTEIRIIGRIFSGPLRFFPDFETGSGNCFLLMNPPELWI